MISRTFSLEADSFADHCSDRFDLIRFCRRFVPTNSKDLRESQDIACFMVGYAFRNGSVLVFFPASSRRVGWITTQISRPTYLTRPHYRRRHQLYTLVNLVFARPVARQR